MAGQKKKQSGGAKKIGKNAKKCEAYRAARTRYKNKARRVLRSNGEAFYVKWKENYTERNSAKSKKAA